MVAAAGVDHPPELLEVPPDLGELVDPQAHVEISPEHRRWSVYPSLTYNDLVFVFIETKLFSRLAEDHLSDDEYKELQQSLIANPEAGDLIRGSGGLRKLRWRGSGRGKRGGLRIIYYLRTRQGEIWLLTLYPKNVSDDIPPKVLRKIKEQIDGQE